MKVTVSQIRQEKEIKCIRLGRKMKGFLFTGNTTVHVENPQNLQKQKQNQTKLLKLTSNFSKTVGGKVYLQKSMHFYTLALDS